MIKYILTLSLLYSFLFSLDNNVLVKIKDEVITRNDFIKRAEYTIRPAYCKSSNQIHKKIILNSLIAEKLMALDINEYIGSDNFSSNFLEGIKEQKMREVFLDEKVYNKINIDADVLLSHISNSTKTYNVNFINISNDTTISAINYLLDNGEGFDRICKEYLGLEEIPSKSIDYFSENEPIISNNIFNQEHMLGDIIGPMVAKDKSVLFVRIIDWVDKPLITDSERKNHKNLILQKLNEIEQIDIYDKFIVDMMKGYKVKFLEKPFFAIADKAYQFYILKNVASNDNSSTGEFDLIEFSKDLNMDINESFLEINKQSFSIEYINNLISKHPLLFRSEKISMRDFPLYFKYAIVDLLRDEQMTQIAYADKYDNHIQVVKEYNLFRGASLSALHLRALLDRNNIPPGDYNNDPELIINNLLNDYVDTLQTKYSDYISIDFDLLDDISLTHIDLYAYKKGVPYPMIVPLFPLLTNRHTIDYGKPINF